MPIEAPPAPPAAATTAPAPPTERPPGEWLGDIASELGDLDDGKPAKQPDDKSKPAPTPDKGKPPAKPAAQRTTPKPDETKPPDDETKPPGDETKAPKDETPEPPKPVKAAELRAAYDGLKKRVREELEPEVQRLKSKVQEFESRKAADPEIEQKLTRSEKLLKDVQTRNDELEKHIAYVDYTQSKEFKEKYAEPYREAWDNALAEFSELTVRERTGDNEEGEPVYTERQADEKDLLHLANMKLAEMDRAANAMFGASASRAINHIQNLKRLSTAQHKALTDAATKAQEWRSQQESQSKEQQANLDRAWKEINQALEEKFPKAFKPEEGDAEDLASHTKGFALGNLLFMGNESLSAEQIEALSPDVRDALKAGKPLTDIQKVRLHAIARLKIANHDRKVVQVKKLQARITELETALAEYEKSEPGADKAGESAAPASKDWQETVESEIRAMDK